MALIKCIECKKEISNKSKVCPNCGAKVKSKTKVIVISIIGVLIFVVLIIVCLLLFLKKDNNTLSNQDTNNQQIEQDQVFPFSQISNASDFANTFNKDQSLILLAYEECKYCTMFSPVLKKVADTYNLSVSMIDVENGIPEELKGVNTDFDNFVNNNFFGTPTLLLYKNGKFITHLEGYKEEENLINELKTNGFIN